MWVQFAKVSKPLTVERIQPVTHETAEENSIR
jgi:hypothetical protein